jgi:hypothetical protein
VGTAGEVLGQLGPGAFAGRGGHGADPGSFPQRAGDRVKDGDFVVLSRVLCPVALVSLML